MIVGFLGTGRIAAPMVKALARNGHEILVSERSRRVSEALAAEFDNVSVRSNRDVVAGSDAVVICLLAAVARDELAKLPFRPEHRVISVMAEITLDEIAASIGKTQELCVTIPMPFIDSGGCPLAVYPASPTLETLFGDDNAIIPVQAEAAMQPHFAATALTSTLLAELIVARDWLGGQTGSTADAERYMIQLEQGYLRALKEDDAVGLDDAVGHLATEGGLNAQLLRHMENAGVMETLREGLDNLLRRG